MKIKEVKTVECVLLKKKFKKGENRIIKLKFNKKKKSFCLLKLVKSILKNNQIKDV